MRYYLVLLLFGISLLASGCNTIRGAGQDLESAGSAIEETAEDAAD